MHTLFSHQKNRLINHNHATMCFCEIGEHRNCAYLNNGQHNGPLFIYTGRFIGYANYQYDVAWANQNPGHVPCESVLRGDFTAAECRQYRGLPLPRRIPLVQDCLLCNFRYQENDHIITVVRRQIEAIEPIQHVTHCYQNRYAGKCWKCAKEGNHTIKLPTPWDGSTGGGNSGEGPPGPPGPPRPTEPRTGATGPPSNEAYKDNGWDKIVWA